MSKTKKITLSALLISLSTMLSFFPKLDSWLANGGSITICSMLPIIIISYRFGIKWGMISATAFACLQLLLNPALPPANNLLLVLVCVLLEYIVAFGFLGLGGIFKNKFNNITVELVLGVIFVLTARFLCHFLAGVIVWGSLIDVGSWQYSLVYNSSYMIPEIIITSIGAVLVSKSIPKILTTEL